MNHQTSMFSHETKIPRSPFASTLTLAFHAVLGLAVILVTAIPSIPRAHKVESLTFVMVTPVPDLTFQVPPAPVPVPKPVVEIPRPEPLKAFEAPAIEKPAPVPVPTPPPPAPVKKIEPPREVPVQKPEPVVGAFDNVKTATRVEPKARVETAGFEQKNAETARLAPELQTLDAFNNTIAARSAVQKTVQENPAFNAAPTTSSAQRATVTNGNLLNADIVTRPAAIAPRAQETPGFSNAAPSRPAATAPPQTGASGFATNTAPKPAAAPPKPAVQVANINDTPVVAKPAPQAPPPPRADRQVEILGKPAPAYTDEARAKGVEGDVVLEVEFTADGQVRVLRVVRGLGYGLDEMAQRAAEKIRFKPATSKGSPVDFRANLTIVFRLT